MAIGTFTVDAALLRELGERLVGHPHVAVVELIKNAYDADARSVEVRLGPDTIEVLDDGHGITTEEFVGRWLRIGSTHKEKERVSRELQRPLTGQKGVGRLAVQFLGRTLTLQTVPRERGVGLEASINWDKALSSGELTEVEVEYDEIPAAGLAFARSQPHGVHLTIGQVSPSVMEALEPKKLAEKLWTLQPPKGAAPDEETFVVRVFDQSGRPATGFDEAMQAYARQWHALLRGNLETTEVGQDGRLQFRLEFDDRERFDYMATIPECRVSSAHFEVRVFSLHGRVAQGIRVGDFRDYLDNYGGVRIFDAGFQLPFYGDRESDWLGIERDHSHRLSTTKLLPEDLRVPRGMNYLPTTTRLLGTVKVDTAAEARWVRAAAVSETLREQPLAIAITRDRLMLNKAYVQLRDAVRTALDFYAMKEASRELTRKQVAVARAPIQSARAAVTAMKTRVDAMADRLRPDVAHDFRQGLDDVLESTRRLEEVQQAEAAVLGTLATAGLLALSQRHELTKQLGLLEEVLEQARTGAAGQETVWVDRLEAWIERTRRTQSLFSAYLEPDNRTRRQRFPVRKTLNSVVDSIDPLLRGVPVSMGTLPPDGLLPAATLAEWTAIFQNVLLNAINAIVTAGAPGEIRLSYHEVRRKRSLRVEDTGVGIDLSEADRYFRPFERALPARTGRDAALGGSGLGLTIVRIVASYIGCHASFVEPADGYATAFELSWDE